MTTVGVAELLAGRRDRRRRRAGRDVRRREVEGHDIELPSGALHDASEMAREVPTVMIFSSSIDGLSHTKEEDTPEDHLVMAADAFERTVRAAVAMVADSA